MAYTFDEANAKAPSKRETQYFELVANRGIYHDGWIANTTPFAPPWDLATGKLPNVVDGYKWELYNITEDFSQYNNLAEKMPDKLKEMQALFATEAAKYNVFPLDNTAFSRLQTLARARSPGKPFSPTRVRFRNSPRQCARHPGQGLHHHRRGDDSRGWRGGNDRDVGRPLRRLRALPAQGQAGLRLQSARSGTIPLGGWRGSRRLVGLSGLKPGKHTLMFDFKYDGPGPGKGGTGVFTVDGKELARKKIEHSIPLMMTIDETFDIGVDTRTGVDDSYKLPFRFTGTIDNAHFQARAIAVVGGGTEDFEGSRGKSHRLGSDQRRPLP